MSTDWAKVDTLIHELGAVRAASFATRGEDAVKAAIDEALAEATTAVLLTFDAPQDAGVIGRARDAIEAAAEVIATLDAELVRSLRMRDRGAELISRAVDLVAQATKLGRP
jgi:hypothetical protein